MLILVGKADGSNLCLQQRCWLGILNYAIGRGGEIRFLCYNDWEYHTTVEVTDITWKELKNLELYAMPVVPDLDSWLFDFYHCMGSYFCVEGGLFRPAEDIKRGLMNVVFPELHRYNISSVAKLITNIIRDSFPYGVPEEVSYVVSNWNDCRRHDLLSISLVSCPMPILCFILLCYISFFIRSSNHSLPNPCGKVE